MNSADKKLFDCGKERPGFLSRLSEEQCRMYHRIPDKVEWVDHQSFQLPDSEERYFGKSCEDVSVPAWTHFPQVDENVPEARVKRTALKAEDEVRMFLTYNYAKYRLEKLIESQQRRKSATRAEKMVLWFTRSMKCRAALVRANLALVLAMAKRSRIPNVDFGEMVSEGNMALLRSVEKFDVSRGFKFSTYACRAILKGFNRMATKTGRYHQRFPAEYDPEMERSDYDVKKHEMQRENSVDAVREILEKNSAKLTEVERKIVIERFAINSRDSRAKGRTLAEVGKMVGLTNERVRQIQNVALEKIKLVLDETYLAA